MVPKYAQLKIFIQTNITVGKNLKPVKVDYIWLAVVL